MEDAMRTRTVTVKEAHMAEKKMEIARREEGGLATRESFFEPFRMMDRFVDEMDRVFDDVFGRGWLAPRFGRSGVQTSRLSGLDRWAPDVEIFYRNNELIVRADLPGLTRDDISVDVNENRVTIHGERKREHEEEKSGVYRSERSYGSFYREIPLPEGTISDQAKASFKDGVLEITMPAPPEQVRRGRRLEIADASGSKK
jgi:HSP20 family protein